MTVQTTFEFCVEKRMEPALRHINPDGSQGGWVAVSAKVDPTSYVKLGAIISPNVVVERNVVIEEDVYIAPGLTILANSIVLEDQS